MSESEGQLSPDQRDAFFERDGYVRGLRVLSAEESRSYRRRFEEIEAAELEKRGGTWENRSFHPGGDSADHPLRAWFVELATHPNVLDAAESLLGPNLLIRNADVFIKEPGQRRGIGWHVDTAMPWEQTRFLVTAWLGLTDSTPQNGCLNFIPGSHLQTYKDGPKDRFSLTFSQTAKSQLDLSSAVANEMPIGCMSFHSFRTVHSSKNNYTDDRRFGFVIRFMSPEISREAAESGVAFLARGTNTNSQFMMKDVFPVSWN